MDNKLPTSHLKPFEQVPIEKMNTNLDKNTPRCECCGKILTHPIESKCCGHVYTLKYLTISQLIEKGHFI